MKKAFFLFLITLGSSNIVSSQDLMSNPDFLKANLYMQNTVILFDEVYNAPNQNEEGKSKLDLLQANIEKAQNHYMQVKRTNPEGEIFKTFEQNIQVLEKSKELLEENDESWALAYSLVKLNLQDFVNEELK